MNTTARQLTSQISLVRDAHASLRGCRRNERANEARILRRELAILVSMEYNRANELANRQADMIQNCNLTLVNMGV